MMLIGYSICDHCAKEDVAVAYSDNCITICKACTEKAGAAFARHLPRRAQAHKHKAKKRHKK